MEHTAEDSVFAVTFRLGSTWLAISAEHVEEICEATAPAVIPLAPSYIPGLINVRGRAVPVLDVGEFLGLHRETPAAEAEGRPRIVVVSAAGMRVGIACDQIHGVADIPSDQLGPPEVTRGERLQEFSEFEWIADDRLVTILDIARLLGAARVRN